MLEPALKTGVVWPETLADRADTVDRKSVISLLYRCRRRLTVTRGPLNLVMSRPPKRIVPDVSSTMLCQIVDHSIIWVDLPSSFK